MHSSFAQNSCPLVKKEADFDVLRSYRHHPYCFFHVILASSSLSSTSGATSSRFPTCERANYRRSILHWFWSSNLHQKPSSFRLRPSCALCFAALHCVEFVDIVSFRVLKLHFSEIEFDNIKEETRLISLVKRKYIESSVIRSRIFLCCLLSRPTMAKSLNSTSYGYPTT